MKIYGIHAQDHQGVGGALRGQEMAYALRGMGHEIMQGTMGNPLCRRLRDEHIDAVIIAGTWHQLLGGGAGALIIAETCEANGVPIIWWYGSNGSIWGAPGQTAEKRAAEERWIIEQICNRQFVGVICPYSMRIYERYGVPREKMRLIPSVFDADLFRPSADAWSRRVADRLRFKFGVPPDAWVLGTVGTIPHSKGGDEMIRAVALAKDVMPDLHYVLLHTPVGNLSSVKARTPDGEEIGCSEREVLEQSKQLASDLNVADRVHFVGARFMRVGMPSFYWMLNGYASPSLADNLPQPPIEAQLCGLPFLTHAGDFKDEFCFDFVSCPETAVRVPPGRRETDDYGLIIPFGDPAALADGIIRLRETAGAPECAAHTRAWAADKFGHHNAGVMVDAIEEYGALLKGNPQAGVGDQADAMTAGYDAAADRIEIEIGKPTGRVLDVGCNTGAGLRRLERRWPDAKCYGIEPEPRFAAKARALGSSVRTGRAEALPWQDSLFDFVFARHSLEHCADRAAACAEIARVLKPGGCIYVQVPIEPNGSANKTHLSPFRSHAEARDLWPPHFTEVYWGPQETVAELIARKS